MIHIVYDNIALFLFAKSLGDAMGKNLKISTIDKKFLTKLLVRVLIFSAAIGFGIWSMRWIGSK